MRKSLDLLMVRLYCGCRPCQTFCTVAASFSQPLRRIYQKKRETLEDTRNYVDDGSRFVTGVHLSLFYLYR